MPEKIKNDLLDTNNTTNELVLDDDSDFDYPYESKTSEVPASSDEDDDTLEECLEETVKSLLLVINDRADLADDWKTNYLLRNKLVAYGQILYKINNLALSTADLCATVQDDETEVFDDIFSLLQLFVEMWFELTPGKEGFFDNRTENEAKCGDNLDNRQDTDSEIEYETCYGQSNANEDLVGNQSEVVDIILILIEIISIQRNIWVAVNLSILNLKLSHCRTILNESLDILENLRDADNSEIEREARRGQLNVNETGRQNLSERNGTTLMFARMTGVQDGDGDRETAFDRGEFIDYAKTIDFLKGVDNFGNQQDNELQI